MTAETSTKRSTKKQVLSKYKHACSQAKRRCIESFQGKFVANDTNRICLGNHRFAPRKETPQVYEEDSRDPEAAATVLARHFLGAAL